MLVLMALSPKRLLLLASLSYPWEKLLELVVFELLLGLGSLNSGVWMKRLVFGNIDYYNNIVKSQIG